MGCDIHMYFEYADNETLEKVAKGEKNGRGELITPYWRDLGGRVNPGRNYAMFGFLSQGVRSDFDNGFVPKGLPPFDELSYSSRNDSVCYITETGEGENETTLERALSWVNNDPTKLHYRGDKPLWVNHPDWHSHNWLTTAEYEQAINNYIEYAKTEDDFGVPAEYGAMLAAMQYLEKNCYTARVVFWFDN
jgi:hypothetical protein